MEQSNVDDPKYFGQYEVVRRLGRGSEGTVYLCKDKLGSNVAVKVVRHTDENDSGKQLMEEAGKLASIRDAKHPGLPTLYEVFESGNYRCFAFQYVDGESIRMKLKRGYMRIEEALRITSSLAETLQFLHDKGILHLDIKPANILVRQDGQVVLVDFGTSAELFQFQRTSESKVVFCGTPPYMAPEVCQRKLQSFDVKADIYSLGAVLYHMLAGQSPFDGTPMMLAYATWMKNPGLNDSQVKFFAELAQHHDQHPKPIPLNDIRDNVSANIVTLCNKAMSVVPVERFESARVFADELKTIKADFRGARIKSPMTTVLAIIFFFIAVCAAVLVSHRTDDTASKPNTALSGESDQSTPIATSTSQATDWTDLLPFVDLNRHVVCGEWTKNGPSIQCNPTSFARFIIPKVPQGNYELSVRFTPLTHNPELNVHLPACGGCVIAKIGGNKPFAYIQDSIERSYAHSSINLLDQGREYILTINVVADDLRALIRVDLDGNTVLRWHDAPRILMSSPEWGFPEPSLGIGVHEAQVRVQEVKIRMSNGSLSSLQEFVPTNILPSNEWIQVLDYVDPKLHAVEREWFHVAGTLQTESSIAFARAVIPISCTGSYEMRALWTWRGAAETVFMIPVGEYGCQLRINHADAEFGIEQVVEIGVDSNRRSVLMPSLEKQMSLESTFSLEIDVTIGDTGDAKIKAVVETAGLQVPFEWSGAASALNQRPDWRLYQGCRLGVGAHENPVDFRSVQIRGNTGEVWQLARSDNADPTASLVASSTANETSVESEKPLPVIVSPLDNPKWPRGKTPIGSLGMITFPGDGKKCSVSPDSTGQLLITTSHSSTVFLVDTNTGAVLADR